MKLSELQQRFINSVHLSKTGSHVDHNQFAYSKEELDARLSIYCNNYFVSTSDILAETFSTVKEIVGEEFFTALATHYMQANPPTNAAMIFLGGEFATFIEVFEHTQNLPYLADVARLEWAQHIAYYAQDAQHLPAAHFSQLDNEQLTSATIDFQPSTQLLSPRYSALSIQEAIKSDNTEKQIRFDEPEFILVVRPDMEVKTFRLDKPTFELFKVLKEGCTLLAALEAAANTAETDDIEFNPSEAIAFLFSCCAIAHLNPQ